MATTFPPEGRVQHKPSVRRARDYRFKMPEQPGQAHRSAAGWMIDYKLQEITDGAVRAISTVAGHFRDKPSFGSPWHYHDCDLQVAIVLDGSIELGYEADTYARAIRGDILFIPGHTLHDVSAPSADYQVAEITFPGTFGTVEAQMPEPGARTSARTLGPRDAVRTRMVSGIIEYRYPVEAPWNRKYEIWRLMRSRSDSFAPASHRHSDRFRMTMVTQGWRQVEVDGVRQELEMGDLLVVPSETDFKDLAYSEDYEAVEVRLLA